MVACSCALGRAHSDQPISSACFRLASMRRHNPTHWTRWRVDYGRRSYACSPAQEAASLGVRKCRTSSRTTVHGGLRAHSAFAGVRIGLARNSRLIPVHPELVRCRFIAYVAQRKAAGQLTLFPVRTNGASDMQTAPSVGRWFARYAQDVGLHPELRTLRSLRSTFLLACALSGMGGNTRAELARLMPRRHAPWSERKFEPNPEGLAALRFYWISQVRFDGLELSHLHVQDPMAGVEEAFSPSAFA